MVAAQPPAPIAKIDETAAPAPVDAKQPKIQAQDKSQDQPNTGKPGVSSLMIDQPQAQAWRLVARALSQQKIEIVERNMDKGYIYVKYDPNEIKPEDNSFWDEMLFLFGEEPSHEQEYRISLLQISDESTEVTIQNSAGKTLSNTTATSLLKLITDGINQDLPADTQKNAP